MADDDYLLDGVSIAALPKVSLHDHLDGALRPQTIIELADEIGLDLPASDAPALGRWFAAHADSGSLVEYLTTFDVTIAVMQTEAGLVRVAREWVLDLAADGVVYGEARWAPEQHLARGLSLDAAVTALNTELAIDSIVEVTMLCGIIDLGTGAVELVNAGHENPWVVRGGAAPEELAMEGGLPLCTLPGYVYPLEHVTLAPGDGLVFITDGVREAQDGAGRFFGSARTRDLLAGWQPGEAAQALTARLVADVRAFEAGTPPSDDLTVLALRWRG